MIIFFIMVMIILFKISLYNFVVKVMSMIIIFSYGNDYFDQNLLYYYYFLLR